MIFFFILAIQAESNQKKNNTLSNIKPNRISQCIQNTVSITNHTAHDAASNRVRLKVFSAPFRGSKTGITVFLLVISSSTYTN